MLQELSCTSLLDEELTAITAQSTKKTNEAV
jgi:hypothetical protein